VRRYFGLKGKIMRFRQLWQVGAIRIALATGLALSSAGGAHAAAAGSVDSYVETLMTRWQIPGAAVAVVQDGKIVFIKGYGLRQTGRPERVDENTTFGLGSVTKSFTASAAAMLVDEGKLAWDAPIIDYLPSLHLADPWITAHGTLRDLASHRLGVDGLLAYFLIGGDLDQTLRREWAGKPHRNGIAGSRLLKRDRRTRKAEVAPVEIAEVRTECQICCRNCDCTQIEPIYTRLSRIHMERPAISDHRYMPG
jgi:CubicO group peptidase (beta-lactamase class C family)